MDRSLRSWAQAFVDQMPSAAVRLRLLLATLVCLVGARSIPAQVATNEVSVVDTASDVIKALMTKQDERIPARLLNNARGVAIIPDVVKGSLVVGLRRGRGVLLLRDQNRQWQRPMFVTLTGASIGWQAGLQATDLVLVFKNRRSVENLLRGKVTLGVDAAVAAGPVGRKASAATDGKLAAEIYSYSRSRGLFAGVSLDGAKIEIDRRAAAVYYGNMPANATPLGVSKLIANLNYYARGDAQAAQPAVPRRSEIVLADLAAAHRGLQPLLDERWRQYLSIPLPQAAGRENRAGFEQLQASLARFDQVARDNRYASLAQRPQFVTVHSLLREYLGAITPKTSRLALPPPPNAIK